MHPKSRAHLCTTPVSLQGHRSLCLNVILHSAWPGLQQTPKLEPLISTTISQTTAGVRQQRPNLRDSRTSNAGQSYIGQGWERVGFSTLQIIQSVSTTREGCRPNSSLKLFLTLRVSTHGLCDTPLDGSKGRCLGRAVPGERTAVARPFSGLGGVRRETSHRASLLLVSYTPH